MALGASLQRVCFVAVLELLLLRGQPGCSFLTPRVRARNNTMRPATSLVDYRTSFRKRVNTYRSLAEEQLRRFAAPNTFKELVDNLLGHFHLHGLHRRRVGLDVAVRSPDEGNASRGEQCSRHVGLLVDCLAKRRIEL
jgi:hypothetical protein